VVASSVEEIELETKDYELVLIEDCWYIECILLYNEK
jgi:hypothetical protein